MEEDALEEIELSPRPTVEPIQLTMETPEFDGAHLRSKFKKEIVQATTNFSKLRHKKDWIPSQEYSDKRISLYERTSDDGAFYIRIKGILNAPAKRIIRLNQDSSFTSRSRWESNSDLKHIEQLQSFNCGKFGIIDVIRSRVGPPNFLLSRLVYDRDFTGIQRTHLDIANNIYTMIFCTTTHPAFPTPSDTVRATGFTGLRVEQLDGNQSKVELILNVHPGGWIPDNIISWSKGHLKDRLLLYERVCSEWRTYYPKRNKTDPRTVGPHNEELN